MKENQEQSQSSELIGNKKKLLLYSLYLSIGSVSLFASLVALNTAYQGFIWSYSQRYIINSFVLAFALFLSGALLVIACMKLVKRRPSARLFGFVGIGFLVVYSFFILFIDRYIAYTLVYMLLLIVLAALILSVAVFFYRKGI